MEQVGKGVKEVEAILEALNIDAGNPAIVMPQDTARTFAGEAGGKEKFRVRSKSKLRSSIQCSTQYTLRRCMGFDSVAVDVKSS